MAVSWYDSIVRCPPPAMSVVMPPVYPNISVGYFIDDVDHAIAFRFESPSTSPITKVDMMVYTVGDTSGMTFQFEIRDSTDESANSSTATPAATILGATNNAKASVAGRSVGGGNYWLGADGAAAGRVALTEDTGTLALHKPYWLVLRVISGTPDAANHLRPYRTGSFASSYGMRVDNGDGTWTHAAYVGYQGHVVFENAAGQVFGYPLYTTNIGPGNIYGTNKWGIRHTAKVQHTLEGLILAMGLVGSPDPLQFTVYVDNVAQFTETWPSYFVSGTYEAFRFQSPVVVPVGSRVDVVFKQEDNGGDSGNYYRFSSVAYTRADHAEALGDSLGNWLMTSGTATDADGLTPYTASTKVGMFMVAAEDGFESPPVRGRVRQVGA